MLVSTSARLNDHQVAKVVVATSVRMDDHQVAIVCDVIQTMNGPTEYVYGDGIHQNLSVRNTDLFAPSSHQQWTWHNVMPADIISQDPVIHGNNNMAPVRKKTLGVAKNSQQVTPSVLMPVFGNDQFYSAPKMAAPTVGSTLHILSSSTNNGVQVVNSSATMPRMCGNVSQLQPTSSVLRIGSNAPLVQSNIVDPRFENVLLHSGVSHHQNVQAAPEHLEAVSQNIPSTCRRQELDTSSIHVDQTSQSLVPAITCTSVGRQQNFGTEYASATPSTTSLNMPPDRTTLDISATQDDLDQMVQGRVQEVPSSECSAHQQHTTLVTTSHFLSSPTFTNSEEDALLNMLDYPEEICAQGNDLSAVKSLPGIDKLVKTVHKNSEKIVYYDKFDEKDLLCCCKASSDREEVPDDQIFMKNDQLYRLPHIGFLSIGSQDFCGFQRNDGEWYISVLELMSSFSASERIPFEICLAAKGSSIDYLSLCMEELDYLRQRQRVLPNLLTTRLLSLSQFREICARVLERPWNLNCVYRTFTDIVQSKCFLKKCTNMKCSKCGKPISRTTTKDTYVLLEEPDYNVIHKEKVKPISPHKKNTFKVGTVVVGDVVFTAFQVDGRSYICVKHLISKHILTLGIMQYRLNMLEKRTRQAPTGLDFYLESQGLRLAREEWIDLVTLQCICCLGTSSLNRKCVNSLYNRLAKGQYEEHYTVEMEVLDDRVPLAATPTQLFDTPMQMELKESESGRKKSKSKTRHSKKHSHSLKSKKNELVGSVIDSDPSACENKTLLKLHSDKAPLGASTLVFLKKNGFVLSNKSSVEMSASSGQMEAVITGVKKQKRERRKPSKSHKSVREENIYLKPRYPIQSRLRKKFEDYSKKEQRVPSSHPETIRSPPSRISEHSEPTYLQSLTLCKMTEKQKLSEGQGLSPGPRPAVPVLKKVPVETIEPHQSSNPIIANTLDGTDEITNHFKISDMQMKQCRVDDTCNDLTKVRKNGDDKTETQDVILFQSESGELLQCTPMFSLDGLESKINETNQVVDSDNEKTTALDNTDVEEDEKNDEQKTPLTKGKIDENITEIGNKEVDTEAPACSIPFTPSSPSTPVKSVFSTPLSSPIISQCNDDDLSAPLTKNMTSKKSFSNSLDMLASLAAVVNQSDNSPGFSEIDDWNTMKENMMSILKKLFKHIEIKKSTERKGKLQLEMLVKPSMQELYPGLYKPESVASRRIFFSCLYKIIARKEEDRRKHLCSQRRKRQKSISDSEVKRRSKRTKKE
ncbi:hypothetical protein ScPMuIL_000774 [Solemya velum]